MRTFLIVHVNTDGQTGVAQARVQAKSPGQAASKFSVLHPLRVILGVYAKD